MAERLEPARHVVRLGAREIGAAGRDAELHASSSPSSIRSATPERPAASCSSLRQLGLGVREERLHRRGPRLEDEIAQPDRGEMREAPRERLRPAAHRILLGVAERREVLLEEPLDPFHGGVAVAAVQVGDHRPDELLRHQAAQVGERIVHDRARLAEIGEHPLAVLGGALRDLVHPDARHVGRGAVFGRHVRRHRQIDDQRRDRRRRARRDPLEIGAR